MPRPHYLIATVGFAPEPVRFAIEAHQPDGVLFIVSIETATTLKTLEDQFAGLNHETLLIYDHENWDEAYQAAIDALESVLRWEPSGAFDVTVDLTGGTKTMTAGLALALSGHGLNWSYVGGEREAGTVKTGTEYIVSFRDPQERFAVLERGALKRAWNSACFEEAQRQLKAYAMKIGSGSVAVQACSQVLYALALWDRFDYLKAYQILLAYLPRALQESEKLRLEPFAGLLGHLSAAGVPQLEALSQPGPSLELVQDVLANAQRRAAAERYDDAFARYESALALTLRFRALQRGRSRGTGPDLAQHFERDYREGRLSALLSRPAGPLANTFGSVMKGDYEALESYVLGEYERAGLYPAEAWPAWPETFPG